MQISEDTTTAWRARAALLRVRGKSNSLHDIKQAAEYLDAAADAVDALSFETPSPQTNLVSPLTYDEVEEIILRTEPPGFSDRDDEIWTRRMAVGIADLFNSRLTPSPSPKAPE